MCVDELLMNITKVKEFLTLVHELVHAIGYDDHDKNFAAKELILLDKYTPVKLEALHEMFEVMI